MKVNEKAYQDEKIAYDKELKALQKRNHHLVTNHQKNLNQVISHNQAELDSQRGLQEKRKLDLHDQKKAELAEFLGQHQQTIDKYRHNLTQTKQILDEAEKNYTQTSNDKMLQKQIENDTLITSTANQAQERAQEIASAGNLQINKIQNDIANQKNQMLTKQNLQTLENGGRNKTDLNQTSRDFVEKRNFVSKEYENHLKFIEKSQKDHLMDVDRKHLVVKQQQLNTNQQELQNIEKKYQQVLKDTHNRYANKISQMNKDNQVVLNNVQDVFTKQINQMKEQQIDAKAVINDRSLDPFYQMLDIGPQIEDLGKEYLISVKVPEHEKEGVLLTPSERKIRISFTRRFEDRLPTPQGFNKSARSENSLQEFTVQDILDTTKVTQTYHDGVLMFKVAKK
ncbi:MAG: hypothetical protein A2381_06665 [Bdellovibrionales bacterium RIFOXYB1_FULL_37_110]|nr:MAG: hypothetical protein A2181_08685 [Bdellovibrionales bacterium RIFOXYA1_FULL_38_20]OFZ50224.1 MAG: hypothetical protein A2417_19515 [Bdellovibrionales bacterium RIFOXYC1_FULL_37_79]OFZ54459.1 MAG: hypothetical protein A2328_12185 [Bdellovibrionales bacterium RIFOXYB2_FULL_36_6]OFZ57661.1 MAG: hypothetical protein A2381_06665 [Bdellovibrionales bacterium RIFOXYB1_FULL_37_110]OFZ61428.1 MAG: hypothetical protein A2577_01030 [Bdellovibrionales bacterium RIFOXYD1_FULL_36_51]